MIHLFQNNGFKYVNILSKKNIQIKFNEKIEFL